MRAKELAAYKAVYDALQAIASCPGRCKCCQTHDEQMLKALQEFLNRWRP